MVMFLETKLLLQFLSSIPFGGYSLTLSVASPTNLGVNDMVNMPIESFKVKL